MKKLMTVVLVLGVVAGCSSRNRQGKGQPFTPQASYAPVALETPKVDLTTDPTRRAKTVEWAKVSTTEGTRFSGGALRVDRILRGDADGLLSTEVRLENTTPAPVQAEYRILFYNENGEKILGFREDWSKISLEPAGYGSITASARLGGAVGFRLYVRGEGEETPGRPSDADAVEQEIDDLLKELEK